jgi:hypothetical protein
VGKLHQFFSTVSILSADISHAGDNEVTCAGQGQGNCTANAGAGAGHEYGLRFKRH